jgi:hypothetical protein
MNTLNTAVSAIPSFFSTKEDYLAFKAHWKDLARNKAITSVDAALRVLVLNQDAERSMPPTKNPVRLANGALHDSGLYHAMVSIIYEASQAQRYLDAKAKGASPTKREFAARWEKHGVSPAALASLGSAASARKFPKGA